MDKQKALIKKLLTALSIEDAETVISSMFPADDKTEPSLDIEALLTAAQEYSKPFLEPHFEKTLKERWKTQYTNDLLGKLAQSSGGLLKTTEAMELKDLKKATDLLTTRIRESVGKPDEEKEKMIEELNRKLEESQTTLTTEVEKIKGEYQQKEEARTVSEKAFDLMSKKSLAVNPSVASKGVLSALSEKYHVKFNPQSEKFELYDKADPTKKAKKNDTAFASFEEEADSIIKEYNWEAKSKGGGGKTSEQLAKEAEALKEKESGKPVRKGSALGAAYAKAAKED